jgi:hypothetical protein
MLLPFCIPNLQILLSSVLITDFIYNSIIRIGPFQTYLHVGVTEPTMGSIRCSHLWHMSHCLFGVTEGRESRSVMAK